MSKEKKVAGNAKRAAYAAKQEKEGNKVIGWIIGVLIGLGVVFAIFSCFMKENSLFQRTGLSRQWLPRTHISNRDIWLAREPLSV